VRPLDLLGAGIVLAWLALPLLAWAARPMTEQHPAGAYRRILAALVLSAVCLALPWLRSQLPSSTHPLTPLALSVQVLATPVGGQQFGAMRGFAASPFHLLAVLWGCACAVASVRWGVARLRLTLLLARAVPAAPEQQQALTALAQSMGVSRPRLLVSGSAQAPFSVGVVTPSIVLPLSLAEDLPAYRLELILRHELTHLRRRDPLTHGLARACTTLFALHPRITALMRELTVAREAAVDSEIATSDRHAYASLLVELASLARFGQDPAHVSMDDTALARRIAMLTQCHSEKRRRTSASPLWLTAAAVAGLSLFAPRVFADGAPFQRPLGAHDPMAEHEGEIDECYALAREEDADLVINTRARFEVDPRTFKVISANVPTPASPTFQACVEDKAMTWSFPPPPDMPPPPRELPPGAKAMVAVHIEREP
jgi:hypothetical protein